MKKKTLLLTFVVLMVGFVSAQAQSNKNSGAGFAYQAVLRDVNGNVLDKREVKLTFSLHANETADAQWSQTKELTTDQFGVVKTIVGKGNDDKTTADGFSKIDFGKAQYWFKVELEVGGEAKREISFAQLPSMPYAEIAHSVSFTMPVGAIVPFAGHKAPEGWMVCDGRPLAIDEYPALYDVIGDNWPKRHATGNIERTEEGHFRIPDLRGIFLRGLDPREKGSLIAYDYERTLGSYQTAATDIRDFGGEFMTMTVPDFNTTIPSDVFSKSYTKDDNYYKKMAHYALGAEYTNIIKQTITLTVPDKYKEETRPVNRAVNYIIKY